MIGIILSLTLTLSNVTLADDKPVHLEDLKCETFKGMDLIGRKLPDVLVGSEKKFYAKKKAKFFGGSLLSDSIHGIDSWKICNRTIEALVRVTSTGNIVRDVVEETSKSKHVRTIVTSGVACKKGKDGLSDILAFVDDSKEMEWFPAKKVFQINLKTEKFKEILAKDVQCENVSYGE